MCIEKIKVEGSAMKLKNILTVMFIVCMSFMCLAGCANVEFVRMVDSYHAIMDKFIVTLDKSKLGSQYASVRNAVYDDMLNFRNYVIDWIKLFENDYPETYLTLSEGIVCQDVANKDNELSITLQFSNTYCFGMFYGLVVDDEIEYTKAMTDKGPFVSHMLMQEYDTEGMGLFLYKYSLVNAKSFLDDAKNFVIEGIGTNYYHKYNEIISGYSIDDLNVSQVFAYPDDRIYSNADEKEVSDGFSFLYWDLSDKDKDFQMSIYKIAPEVAVWYISGLIISVVTIILLFIVLNRKRKNTIEVKITKKEVEKDER